MTPLEHARIPAGLPIADTTVDLLVVGSGTGMAAALAAAERGLSVLIVEKSSYVGGSTARSGGALWLPGEPGAGGGRRRRLHGAGHHLPGCGRRGLGTPQRLDGIPGSI